MLKSLDNAPPIPEDWIMDVFVDESEQDAMDIWKQQHNLKVLEQRIAFKEFFGFDADDYPDWQDEKAARGI